METTKSVCKYEIIWEKKSPQLKNEIIDFWVKHKALLREEAEDRVEQATIISRSSANEIVGVGTAYSAINPTIGHPLYYYRTFVAPEWRCSYIAKTLLLQAQEFFNGRFESNDPTTPIGMCLVVENTTLKTNYNEAIWPDTNFVFVGRTNEGNHIRIAYFDGARILPSAKP